VPKFICSSGETPEKQKRHKNRQTPKNGILLSVSDEKKKTGSAGMDNRIE